MFRAVSTAVLSWVAMQAGVRTALADSPFATEVIEFSPAPGQHANHAMFNDPARALGAPVGGGTVAANHSSVVSLGGFGGTIVLSFDHTVMDEAANPLGLDAIVFGNAFWVGPTKTRHGTSCRGRIWMRRGRSGRRRRGTTTRRMRCIRRQIPAGFHRA